MYWTRTFYLVTGTNKYRYSSSKRVNVKLMELVPIVTKLQFVLIARDSSTKFYINPFTTRVPIVIDPSHTLVYELSGSNDAHTRHDQTYRY